MSDNESKLFEPPVWRFSGQSLRRKGTFYTEFETGLFGNKARTWNSYGELVASGWKDLVCIRGKGIPREDVKYNIPFEDVRKEVDNLISKGYPEYILRFNQSMPDYALSVQGEVRDIILSLDFNDASIPQLFIPGEIRDINSPLGFPNIYTPQNGFELTYTFVKKPMNEGLKEQTLYARGIPAKMILQGRMDPSSFRDLEALLGIFSDSAIEFSTYEVAVGDIPNRNTVFWEVRNY